MLHLRVYGQQSSLTEVGLSLEARGTAGHVALAPGSGRGARFSRPRSARGKPTPCGVLKARECRRRTSPSRGSTTSAPRGRVAPAPPLWADMMAGSAQRPAGGALLALMLMGGVIAGLG